MGRDGRLGQRAHRHLQAVRHRDHVHGADVVVHAPPLADAHDGVVRRAARPRRRDGEEVRRLEPERERERAAAEYRHPVGAVVEIEHPHAVLQVLLLTSNNLPDGAGRVYLRHADAARDGPVHKRVTNKIQGRYAHLMPGYGMLEHTGRKSGRSYRVPVNVFAATNGFVVVLFYGRDSDWVRNVLAAGGGRWCTAASATCSAIRRSSAAPRAASSRPGRSGWPCGSPASTTSCGSRDVPLDSLRGSAADRRSARPPRCAAGPGSRARGAAPSRPARRARPSRPSATRVSVVETSSSFSDGGEQHERERAPDQRAGQPAGQLRADERARDRADQQRAGDAELHVAEDQVADRGRDRPAARPGRCPCRPAGWPAASGTASSAR